MDDHDFRYSELDGDASQLCDEEGIYDTDHEGQAENDSLQARRCLRQIDWLGQSPPEEQFKALMEGPDTSEPLDPSSWFIQYSPEEVFDYQGVEVVPLDIQNHTVETTEFFKSILILMGIMAYSVRVGPHRGNYVRALCMCLPSIPTNMTDRFQSLLSPNPELVVASIKGIVEDLTIFGVCPTLLIQRYSMVPVIKDRWPRQPYLPKHVHYEVKAKAYMFIYDPRKNTLDGLRAEVTRALQKRLTSAKDGDRRDTDLRASIAQVQKAVNPTEIYEACEPHDMPKSMIDTWDLDKTCLGNKKPHLGRWMSLPEVRSVWSTIETTFGKDEDGESTLERDGFYCVIDSVYADIVTLYGDKQSTIDTTIEKLYDYYIDNRRKLNLQMVKTIHRTLKEHVSTLKGAVHKYDIEDQISKLMSMLRSTESSICNTQKLAVECSKSFVGLKDNSQQKSLAREMTVDMTASTTSLTSCSSLPLYTPFSTTGGKQEEFEEVIRDLLSLPAGCKLDWMCVAELSRLGKVELCDQLKRKLSKKGGRT